MTTTHVLGLIAVGVMVAVAAVVTLICYAISLIAQSRRHATATREARRRLADVVELVADWVWETDAEHRFVYLSDRFAEVTGLEPGDFIGQKRTELPSLISIEPSEWNLHLKAVRAREPFHNFQYTYVDGDGAERIFAVSGKPLFDARGNFQGYRGTGRDMTEAITARADATAAEERARLVLDSALDAFVSFDENARIVDWNPSAQSIFGWRREEVVGRNLQELIVPAEILPAHRKMLERLRAGGSDLLNRRARTAAVRRSGAQFPCELTITESRTQRTRVFNAFMRDITEQERHRQALEQARQDAEIASRAKSDFLAAMSHELRTPLNAVIGFAALLSQHPDIEQERRREYLNDIHTSGQHLLDLINDILDLSKIEAGRLELNEELLDIAEPCRACVRLLTERAENAELDLTVDLPADLPPVVADAQRVKQVLINLLSNAIKFTEPGGRVSLSVAYTPGDDLSISVSDTGVGMNGHEVAKAFEPFSQLDSGYDRQREGTGLGLALAKTLTELHGGQLHIETAPGAGTRVSFTFPKERIHRGDDQDSAVAQGRQRAPVSGETAAG